MSLKQNWYLWFKWFDSMWRSYLEVINELDISTHHGRVDRVKQWSSLPGNNIDKVYPDLAHHN